MPTVLRVDGFELVIFLPGREHGPAHVHVYKQGGMVTVLLEDIRVRDAERMRSADVRKAVRIVEEHAEFLRSKWREYHE